MYRLPRFAKKLNSTDMLNVQNWVNSTGNCVHQMFGLFGFTEKFEFFKYVECTKLCKFNVKFCTLDVWIVWISR